MKAYRLLWANRSVRGVVLSRACNLLALAIFSLESIWLSLQLTGNSGTRTALLVLAEAIPFVLFGLIGGVQADRQNKARTMRWCDAVNALNVTLLPMAYYGGWLTFPLLVGISALQSLLNAYAHPAFRAVLPELVEGAALTSANALCEALQRGTMILAPIVVAGLMRYVEHVHAFTLVAGCYLLSVLSLWRVQSRVAPVASAGPPPSRTPIWRELLHCRRYVRARPRLWSTILASGAAISVSTGFWRVAVPLAVKTHFSGDLHDYSRLVAGMGIASLAGSLLLGVWTIANRYRAFQLGMVLRGVSLLAMAFAPNFFWLYGLVLCNGLGLSLQGLNRILIIQDETEPHMMGKVFSLSATINYASDSISYLLAGGLLAICGAMTSLALAGGCLVALAVCCMLQVSRKESVCTLSS